MEDEEHSNRSSSGSDAISREANNKSTSNVSNCTASRGNKDEGFVDTNKADRAVWLMKCPPVASTFFLPPSSELSPTSSTAHSYAPIAKVVLSIDPLVDSSPEFKMELNEAESGNVPKSFDLNMSKDFIPLAAFSESNEGSISVEGKIQNKLDMKVTEDMESYGKLCRDRAKKSMTKNRQIKIIGNDIGTFMRPMPGMVGGFGTLLDKKKIPKVSELKRTRRERGEMEGIMFKLFETQPNWSLRTLIHETQQPEQFLKDMLKDLCVYNNKGINQGTYELKPEYKRTTDDPT